MDDTFIICLERLRDGKSYPLALDATPAMLDIGDDELTFGPSIQVQGSAYLAEDHVVVQVSVQGSAQLACSVCNQPVKIPFKLKNVYMTKPLADTLGGRYNFKEDLREAILLEIPSFVECNEGECPQRVELERYLKPTSLKSPKGKENTYFPFGNLEEQMKKK